MSLAFCIECRCHDMAACETEADGACYWLDVDYEIAAGVCSACPEALDRWNSGERKLKGGMNGLAALRALRGAR